MVVGQVDEMKSAAQVQCAKCGATENLGVRCAHPDCPNRSAATPRWRMTFDVWVEAENQEAAENARNRIGDRIEGQLSVVGCEDSPVERDDRYVPE